MVQIVSPETAISWLRKWNAGKRAPKEVPVRFRIFSQGDDSVASNRMLQDQRAMNLIERGQIYDRNPTPQSSVTVKLNETQRTGRQTRSPSTRVKEGQDFLPGSYANDMGWSREEFGQVARSWRQPDRIQGSEPRPGIRGIEFPEDSVPRIPVVFSRPQLTSAPPTGNQPLEGEPWVQPSSQNWRRDGSDIAAVGSSGPSVSTIGRGSQPRFGRPSIDMSRMRRLVRTDVFGDTASAEADSLTP
jgi:hypothetical protein